MGATNTWSVGLWEWVLLVGLSVLWGGVFIWGVLLGLSALGAALVPGWMGRGSVGVDG